MKKYALGIGLAVVVSTGAYAVDAPQPFPTRDVLVHYQDRGGTEPASYVMNYSAQLKKIRMQIDGQPDYNIMEVAAKRNIMVMGADHAYIEMAANKIPVNMMVPDGGTMSRTGQDQIAGLSCTVWNIKLAGRDDGTVCVTDDGVLLRSHYNDGKNETTEATGVEFKPQPASLFEVPADFAKMEMPAMPTGGAGMPALPADMGSE